MTFITKILHVEHGKSALNQHKRGLWVLPLLGPSPVSRVQAQHLLSSSPSVAPRQNSPPCAQPLLAGALGLLAQAVQSAGFDCRGLPWLTLHTAEGATLRTSCAYGLQTGPGLISPPPSIAGGTILCGGCQKQVPGNSALSQRPNVQSEWRGINEHAVPPADLQSQRMLVGRQEPATQGRGGLAMPPGQR